VIARGTGAFLVALLAIGFVLGPFEGRDFLVGLLVAAAIGVAAAFWLGRDERKPAPDVFDERATRRAVRRGVLRTGLVAVVWAVLGLIVLQIASGVWQRRGDRGEHFETVARYGFLASHPGFRPGSRGCCNSNLRSIEIFFSVEPRTAGGLTAPVDLPLRLDLRGRLVDEGRYDLPRTAVDAAGDPMSKPALRSLLRDLPERIVATGVAELARPLSSAAFFELLERHGLDPLSADDVPVYLEPKNVRPRQEGIFLEQRVSWPTPALAEFQAWVKQLRPGDDRVLDGLELPSSASLRALAADPRIHGFVVDRATPDELRRLLDEPAVRGVAIGDIAFDLGEQR
jgi:hypothetical protein